MKITCERFESAHADLWDATPLFDLRIRSGHRGRGLGRQGLTWLTRYVFTEFPPGPGRIEGATRQDNVAMRHAFRSCGHVKELGQAMGSTARNGSPATVAGVAPVNAMMSRCRWDWSA